MEGTEQKTEGKGKAKGKGVNALRSKSFVFIIFAFCLLPFAFLKWALPGSHVSRTTEAPTAVRPSETEADEVLRRAAQSALGGREGAVLVLDAQTGRVRALAGGRAAFEEATPPGSAVKPFTMLTALRAGSLDEETRVYCRGRYRHEDFKINCSHPRYRAAFGPAQALANSCNYFFAHVAESLDGDTYARTLREFGFGARTGGGDEHEAAGLLPRETPRVQEMLGESSELRVTPAQLAAAYTALFNGGRLLAPRVARAEGFTPLVRARLDVAPAHRALLLAGMRGVVTYGTASRAGLATLPVYVFGKTGTSTPQDGWRAQGWFVGFAAGRTRPGGEASASDDAAPEDVRLTVLVFLKRSRGAEAAELARPIFEAYARTLAVQDEPQLANLDANSEAQRARASNSNDEGGTDEDGGTVVRVRLSRGDATLALPLEEYVFGVLAAEGSVESEAEALKALAVVARTYALKNLRRHARDHFDLCDTTHCQRFAPVRDESARPGFYELAHRAVRETAGEVLRDASGRVTESYFSAACGGRTADIAKLWGVERAPAHLRGVRDDFCSGADESWTDVIPSAQLLRALRADERSDVGARLEGVRVVRRDQTGRAELVELEGARRRVLRGWDFKIIVGRTLGWNVLKSSRFDVARAGSAYVFHGTGFGHGLGLCQAGAHVSATRGASYRQILGRYFPGTSVGRPELHETNAGLRDADFGLSIDESRAVEPRFATASSSADGESVSATFQHAVFHQELSGIESVALSSHPALSAISNPQTARSNQLRSEHFRLSYPARVARRDAEALLRTFESARADVTRRLERASIGGNVPDVEVTLYETTGDFVGATGEPAWVAAVTTGRRIELQPLDVLRRRGVLLTTPRHEFVHAALEATGGGRAPRWLVEGLAAHVAGEGPQLARSAPEEKITTEELERRLARPGSPREMRALYAAAYAEVSALVRREGESAVWRRAVR
ncbi:MAG: stage sporulation protein [Acidobacteriota bacterium]|jgi:SpoIID/LytB domain protein|nr:stage sporulation protein [Acidobacteriota bacterium]